MALVTRIEIMMMPLMADGYLISSRKKFDVADQIRCNAVCQLLRICWGLNLMLGRAPNLKRGKRRGFLSADVF